MAESKLKCRECNLCNVKEEKCSLTGRKITLDSLRKCKKGIKTTTIEEAEKN